MTFTDRDEALAFLATLHPPVTVTIYEADTKTVRYQAQSATHAHAHFVIEQVLGPGRPGDLIVTLRTAAE